MRSSNEYQLIKPGHLHSSVWESLYKSNTEINLGSSWSRLQGQLHAQEKYFDTNLSILNNN